MTAFKKAVDVFCSDAHADLKLECHELALEKQVKITRQMMRKIVEQANKRGAESIPLNLPTELKIQMEGDAIDKLLNAQRSSN